MKNNKMLKIFFFTFLTALFAFAMVGCDEMDNENHSTEEGRTGTSGASIILTITPSRAPSNSSSTMNVHCRLVDLKDLSGIANVRIRLAIQGFASAVYDYSDYLDPYVISFSDDTLLIDVVTNANGEASTLMHVGNLPRAIPEVPYVMNAAATVEFDHSNIMRLFASETFYIYNPHWDGTELPDTTPPTAVINYFPTAGITPGTTITFMGANSYDGMTPSGERKYNDIMQYSWNFADGGSGSGQTVTHAYAGIGSYTVELFVVDDEGMTGQSSAAVSVVEITPTPTF